MFSRFSLDVLRMSSIDHRYSIDIFRCVQDVLRCSYVDVHRCFEMITDVFGFSLDIL